jgi:putative ABC transport system permease protein
MSFAIQSSIGALKLTPVSGSGYLCTTEFLPIPVLLNIPIIFIAIASAAIVGIFFGYYPARKASRLNPIDALHYE